MNILFWVISRYRKFLKHMDSYEIIVRALDPDSGWVHISEDKKPTKGHYMVIVCGVDDVLRISTANYVVDKGWDNAEVVLWKENS